MISSEQNAEDERRESVGREQPAHFRREKFERVFAAQYQNELNRRELNEDGSEDEKHA